MHSDELKNHNQLDLSLVKQNDVSELRLLRSELAEMRSQIHTQNAELQSLRQQLGSPAQVISNVVQDNPTSRRTMLKRVGGAAAGLAALSLAAGLNPAAAFADEPAVDANGLGGATASYGGQFAGDLAQLRLVPAAAAGGRTTNTHAAGELYVDNDNNLYFYNGTAWSQLNTQTVYLPTPLRLVGPFNSNYAAFPTITGGTSSTYPIAGISITNNNPGGTVTGSIPLNATGVIGVLSVIFASGGGYATIYPAGVATAPAVASNSYAAGTIAGAAVSVKLGSINATTSGVAVYSTSTCQVAIDIVAYTL